MIKRNPRDEKLLKNIKINKHTHPDGDIEYTVIYDDKIIAIAEYSNIFKWIEFVRVTESFRRRGIASYLYDYVEKDQNIKLKPSSELLKNGEEFWKNRLKKNPMKRKVIKNPETKKQLTEDILYNLKKLKQKLETGKFTLKQLKDIDLEIATLV